jgi:hypothetical protein
MESQRFLEVWCRGPVGFLLSKVGGGTVLPTDELAASFDPGVSVWMVISVCALLRGSRSSRAAASVVEWTLAARAELYEVDVTPEPDAGRSPPAPAAPPPGAELAVLGMGRGSAARSLAAAVLRRRPGSSRVCKAGSAMASSSASSGLCGNH